MRLRLGHRTLPVLLIFAVALLALLGARPSSPTSALATGDIAQTYSISGTVRDGDSDKPVPGVVVTLGPGFTATTGADGAYSFTELPGGTYTLTPAKDGGIDSRYFFQPESRTITLEADLAAQDFVARREITSYIIDVVVKDRAGAVIPAAEIFITNLATGLRQKFSTGPNPSSPSILNLPAGNYRFQARKPGYSLLPATRTINVPLEREVMFSGQRMIALPMVMQR
jgi:hypothetical protein